MCMELHLDHDHHAAVSHFGDNRSMLVSIYRNSFPGGAVHPHQ